MRQGRRHLSRHTRLAWLVPVVAYVGGHGWFLARFWVSGQSGRMDVFEGYPHIRCVTPNRILAYQVPHPICHPTTDRGSERQMILKNVFLHGRWHTHGRCETHGGSNGWGRSPPAAQRENYCSQTSTFQAPLYNFFLRKIHVS